MLRQNCTPAPREPNSYFLSYLLDLVTPDFFTGNGEPGCNHAQHLEYHRRHDSNAAKWGQHRVRSNPSQRISALDMLISRRRFAVVFFAISQSVCYCYGNMRVIGGTNAEKGKYPWVVALETLDKQGNAWTCESCPYQHLRPHAFN